MSHFARGTCCGVVLMLGLLLTAQMSASDKAGDPFGEPQGRKNSENSEERIKSTLDQLLKTPLDFTEQPLNEIIETLQEEYDIPIVFDNAALDEVAISPETELTINFRHITLRSALKLMLRQPGLEDLTFVVDDEVLMITTIDRANATLTICMYRVDDLNLFGDTVSTGQPQGFSSLTSAIKSCVSYDSWKANGKGEGELVLVRPGILIVANTRNIQSQVESFLDQLRGVKAKIEERSSGSVEISRRALVE